ncbi:MAG: PHP domain-containing protein [Desulfarculaceae bacterium]|nr:PHP domain-containing protein [Desulfarculaceae bacterium]
MISFMRNKLVGVERPSPGTWLAKGVLEDHIYGLEVALSIDADSLRLESVQGAWRRYTTPECPRAVQFLGRAEGLCLSDPEFSQQVHKLVGRQACRHFANLILECCDCVLKARAVERGEIGVATDETPERPAEPAVAARPRRAVAQAAPDQDLAVAYAALEDAPQGFFLDLHAHTFPASPCASDEVDQVLAEAKRIGLHGVCLTDHHYLWDPEELAALSERHGLVVLGGNEITTAQGDMVVFGFDEPIEGIIPLEELRARVAAAGGFIVAAHPFRGFLTVGVEELGMGVEQAAGRAMFAQVDALEVLNSKVTPGENGFCARVAGALAKPGTGGSDAHQAGEVGFYATRFDKIITSQADLLAALRHGSYQAVPFRGAGKAE